jgi:flagellar biosynthetic protein FliO
MKNWSSRFRDWWDTHGKNSRWLPIVGIVVITISLIIGVALKGSTPLSSTETPTTNQTDTFALALDVMIKLGLVVVVIFVAAVFFRRWQNSPKNKRRRHIQIIETAALSPRRNLHIIEIEGHQYLIGATDQGIQLITDLTGIIPETLQTVTKDFDDVMQQVTDSQERR